MASSFSPGRFGSQRMSAFPSTMRGRSREVAPEGPAESVPGSMPSLRRARSIACMVPSANYRENQKGPAGGAGPNEAETAKPPFPSNPKNPVRLHHYIRPPGERFGLTHRGHGATPKTARQQVFVHVTASGHNIWCSTGG